MDYKEAVENLAKAKSNYLFRNSSPEHAAIVLSTMLKHSEKEFRLYDDNLNGDIADQNEDFYKSLDYFILTGKKLKIVVDRIENRENTIFNTLNNYRESYPERVFISTSTESFRNKVNSVYNKKINFAVGDSNSFRLEDVSNEIARKALCSFNNSEYTKKLIEAFDAEFNSCPEA